MNKQQTAVEWLFGQIKKDIIGLEYDYADELEQAKEMDKEMTVKLYNDYENYLEEAFNNQNGGQAVILSFKEFYELTYGGNK
jgi:hypothetical protein